MKRLLLVLARPCCHARRWRRSRSSPPCRNGARWRRKSAATRSGLRRHHGLQDPHRIEAQAFADRPCPQRRPGRRHRRRTGNRLAAAGAARIRQRPHPARASRAISRRRGRSRMLEMPAGSIAPTATCMPAAIRTSRPIRATILKVGEALAAAHGGARSGQCAGLPRRLASFAERWRARWRAGRRQAAPLKGVAVVVQHKAWPYLYDWLGLREVATLEPKPGVEPSVAHLGGLRDQAANSRPRMVMRAAYNSPRPPSGSRREAKVPAVVLPFTVGGTGGGRPVRAVRRPSAPAGRRLRNDYSTRSRPARRALRRRPAGAGDPCAAGHEGACGAASSSSTSPWRRWPRWA